MRNKLLAAAIIAGMQASMGYALAGNGSMDVVSAVSTPLLAPPVTRRGSATRSAYTDYGYPSGPGWSAAHVKRMATKRRNRQRNKSALRASHA